MAANRRPTAGDMRSVGPPSATRPRSDDDQIPFVHAERLRAALARDPRAEIHVGRGLHNDRDPDFERRVFDFFAKHLR